MVPSLTIRLKVEKLELGIHRAMHDGVGVTYI